MKRRTKKMEQMQWAIEQIKTSRTFRQRIASRSHLWFLLIYFPHYLTDPLGWFHYEMLDITEDERIKLAVVMAFRGSGKSTIMNLSYSLWAALGRLNKKFVVLVSRSQKQINLHFENIWHEWNDNEMLRNDFGNLKLKNGHVDSYLSLPEVGSRIMKATTTQSIRGLRFGKYRPDLIICDDVEDSVSCRSDGEMRRTYEWFTNEVMPCGDGHGKIIVLGNLLHKDSLLMRLRREIGDKNDKKIFRAYPFLDEDGKCLWPEKFATVKSIDQLRDIMHDAWGREYLLTLVPGMFTRFKRESLKRYIKDFSDEDRKIEERRKFARNVKIGAQTYCISAPIIGLNHQDNERKIDLVEEALKRMKPQNQHG